MKNLNNKKNRKGKKNGKNSNKFNKNINKKRKIKKLKSTKIGFIEYTVEQPDRQNGFLSNLKIPLYIFMNTAGTVAEDPT